MGIKPTIEILPPRALSIPPRGNMVTVATPPQMVTVPPPLAPPITIWGAGRQARYYDALRDVANAQNGYLCARTELTKTFVAAARAAHEVAELPEICESDTQIRRLERQRDLVNAGRELEEARYGLYATQIEVDNLRNPRIKKATSNVAAIDAILKSKVEMEVRGEDTSEIDQTLTALQRAEA